MRQSNLAVGLPKSQVKIASLGRFAQADTIVPAGVQGYDRYAYVQNNPLRYTDPSGHAAWNEHQGNNRTRCDLDCWRESHQGDDEDLFSNFGNPYIQALLYTSKAFYTASWAFDAWLYNHNVPTAFGVYAPEINLSPPGIFTFEGGLAGIYNWRSGELDFYISGGAGGTAAIPPSGGASANIILFSVTGASSNSSWEGSYISVSAQGYAPAGAVGGQTYGTTGWKGFVNAAQNNDSSKFFSTDTQSGKPIVTNFGGVGLGSPSASLNLTFGTTFARMSIFDFDLPIPFVLPNNPYLNMP